MGVFVLCTYVPVLMCLCTYIFPVFCIELQIIILRIKMNGNPDKNYCNLYYIFVCKHVFGL